MEMEMEMEMRDGDGDGDGDEAFEKPEAAPGPTLLAAVSHGGILFKEETGGSVSISINTLEDTRIADRLSSSGSLLVSDSVDSSTERMPVKSLSPQDLARLEEEERWLEQAIEERIAFLKR